MMQYIIILLDETSVSFCHYANSHKERHLMPLDTLKAAVVYAMKENLNVQFVYPDYKLPDEYLKVIDSVDHSDIKSAGTYSTADALVIDGIDNAAGVEFYKTGTYILRITRLEFFEKVNSISEILGKVGRLNVILTDIDKFTDDDFKLYNDALSIVKEKTAQLLARGKEIQINLITDRLLLDKMNNCGAGETTITLAPNGKFYICPGFFVDGEPSVGDLERGPIIPNVKLYRLENAPICRHCDAFQCKRCVWMNKMTTLEVNTPGHEQCVVAHIERNTARKLQTELNRRGMKSSYDEIPEIDYLDPFDKYKEW